MKTIGLIGGLSWVSTAAYYRCLNEIVGRRLGGVASARLLLASVNRQDYVDAVIDRNDEETGFRIVEAAARSIEAGGADFAVICCNDVHRFVPRLAGSVSLPFLHVAEAAARAVRAAGLRRVGLLGVRKTMEGDFYPAVLRAHGIETIVPDEPDRTWVHDSIYGELVHDVFTAATRGGYGRVVERLAAAGAEGVILGCTEIPLLLRPDDLPVPSFDTTTLHCEAAVDAASSDAPSGPYAARR